MTHINNDHDNHMIVHQIFQVILRKVAFRFLGNSLKVFNMIVPIRIFYNSPIEQRVIFIKITF